MLPEQPGANEFPSAAHFLVFRWFYFVAAPCPFNEQCRPISTDEATPSPTTAGTTMGGSTPAPVSMDRETAPPVTEPPVSPPTLVEDTGHSIYVVDDVNLAWGVKANERSTNLASYKKNVLAFALVTEELELAA